MKMTLVGRIGVVALVIACAVGCATGAKGPSDEELVNGLLGSWNAGVLAKDVDKIMATYADSFTHKGYDFEAADKAALRKFVEDCVKNGYFEGIQIALNQSATKIKGDTATIEYIECTNTQGMVTIGLTAQKSAAGWLFTDMTIEGL